MPKEESDGNNSKKKDSDIVWHHIVPRSRGGIGKYWNFYPWRFDQEKSWHNLFGIHLPSQCINKIKELEDFDGNLDRTKISDNDIKNFQKVFSHKNPKEAIRFIEENFLPAEQRFLKEKGGNDE